VNICTEYVHVRGQDMVPRARPHKADQKQKSVGGEGIMKTADLKMSSHAMVSVGYSRGLTVRFSSFIYLLSIHM
jgi:hypothetical protein